MESRRIASTSVGGLKFLGRPSDRDHGRLAAQLSAVPALGPSYATLFAEPVPTRDGTRIDWYVPAYSSSLALDALPAEQQAEILRHVEAMLAKLVQEAERLKAANNPLGDVLLNSAKTPEPLAQHIYVVTSAEGESHPVIVS